MATGYFEFDIQIPYTITQNNAVGPTNDAGFRPNASLPNPLSGTGAKNDANTIYLDAFAGSDANSGFTLALAKQTWSGANSAVTPARYTIHIENTGMTDSTFTETLVTGLSTLSADLQFVQVAEQQTATLNFSGGYYTWVPSNPIIFNGLEINTSYAADPLFDYNIGTATMEWVKFTAPRITLLVFGSTSLTLNNSIFISTDVSEAAVSSATVDASQDVNMIANNTIFANVGNVGAGWAFGQNGQPLTVDFTHCVFWGYENAMAVSNGVTSLVTTNNDSHIFHACGIACKDQTTGTPFLDMPITNSLVNVGSRGMASFDNTNVFNQNPLFIDEEGLNFQLAHRGRTYNGIPYPISSPAIGISITNNDAGAWDFTYTPGSETSTVLTLPSATGWDNVKYTVERTNYQSFKSILGYNLNTWDSIRSRIELSLPSNYWVGHDFSYDLLNMFMTPGIKRFYPNGADGLLAGTSAWSWSTAIPLNGDTGLEIILSGAGLPRNMRHNAFRGWIVQLTGTVSLILRTGYYRIWGNGNDTLQLEWIRGYNFNTPIGLTEADADILYMPVIVDMASLELISELYTENEKKPWYRESIESDEDLPDAVSEFHTRTITLLESDSDLA